jgi:murein tripeptide amidase MpaA
MNLITIGTPGANKRALWVIARQHPGETMAEWFVDGMLSDC